MTYKKILLVLKDSFQSRSECFSITATHEGIASHANGAATENVIVLPDTKTYLFIQSTDVPVYVPLSSKTMGFDEAGECTSGC